MKLNFFKKKAAPPATEKDGEKLSAINETAKEALHEREEVKHTIERGKHHDKREEGREKKEKMGLMDRLNNIGTIPQKEIVEFTRHLSVMLTAGITIFEAVEFLKTQTKNKIFSKRLEKILESVGNGHALSNAMHKYPKIFPDIYVNMIAVGEESGTLPKAMTDLANHLEENENFRRKVKGALIYPKIIMTVMMAFIIILVSFVMPRILTIFGSLGAEIPKPTQVMMATSNFINSHFILLTILFVFLIVGFHVAKKHPLTKKYFDLTALKFPMIGHIVLNYNTAQVSQHFGTLFASGITIVKCLQITQSVIQNAIFKKEIAVMIEKIRGGAALSKSFPEKSYFPPMFVKLIKIGEKTGQLPHVIEYMRGYYKELVDNDVKNITVIIEPVIMILLGMMIAGLVVTVIGPIYQLISNISA